MDVYDHLENYEDIKKVEKIKLENKQLKDQIEGYTTTIANLQRDFDKLAAEHRKLELNYSSLLKTARSEIERKTQMINKLNIEKDKLVLRSTQNELKDRYTRFKTFKSKNNNSSDSSVQRQSDEVISKIHNSKTFCKNDNLPSAQSSNNGKTDSNIDKGRNNLHKMNEAVDSATKTCVPVENNMQPLEKLDNTHCETRVKKITNRRKSMPILSNDIKFSSDEDCENSIDSEVFKKNNENIEENVRVVERNYNYNGNRMSETSSTENYSRHHDTYNKKRTSYYKSRDRYESSYIRGEKYSPDRSYRTGANKCGDEYSQRYDYGRRRAYSPSCEKSYHRSRDWRSNYDRNRSRDRIRSRNDDERYVEKHKNLDDLVEPFSKRQKFENGYRYQDYNKWQNGQDYSKRAVYTPLESRQQFSCQSPDHVYNDYSMPTYPIKEIKYTANVPLEDPRLSSKKYKIVRCSDKETITTIIGRNVDIISVDKNAWGIVSIPMPKLLLEPPQSALENLNKNVNFDKNNPSTCNLQKKSPPPQKVVKSDDLRKSNVKSLDSGRFLKCAQKSTVDNKILHDNTFSKDLKQKEKTNNDNNMNMAAKELLGVKSVQIGETVEANVDKIVKKNICIIDSISTDDLKKILQETSKNNLTRDPNSMSKRNINPLSTKKDNNDHKEIIQNIDTVASSGNMINKSKTKKTIVSNMDKINEGYEYKKSNEDIPKDNLKESSKTLQTGEQNSMPKLNLNTISSIEKNNVSKDAIQNNHDIKNNESNNIDKKHDDFCVLSNNVEDDLLLSDETSDAVDTNHIPKKKAVKRNLKKKTYLKNSNKNESDMVTKAEHFDDKKKQVVLKDKEKLPEQSKKQKCKKKTLENKGSDLNQSEKKTKKSKKEKDNAEEIKSKLNELFGDSTSLISTDDLGIVTHESDIIDTYDTIFADTEAAVDLNLKEIEKSQTTIISQNVRPVSLNKELFVKGDSIEGLRDCSTTKDNNIIKNETTECKNTVIYDNLVTNVIIPAAEDTLSLPNIKGKLDEESSDVETVIISSGMQPQNINGNNGDLTQSTSVLRANDHPIKIVALHALATSTPAKTFTDSKIVDSVLSKPQDSSNFTGSTNSTVLSTPMDQSSGNHTDSQMCEDVPDVRIFVKRKRKVRK